MYEFDFYLIVIFALGGLFLGVTLYVLRWATRNRQFEDFEAGSRVVFTEEEPEGVQADFFPKHSKAKATPKR